MLARCDRYGFLISLTTVYIPTAFAVYRKSLGYLRYRNVENPGTIGLRFTCDYICRIIKKTKLCFYINTLQFLIFEWFWKNKNETSSSEIHRELVKHQRRLTGKKQKKEIQKQYCLNE